MHRSTCCAILLLAVVAPGAGAVAQIEPVETTYPDGGLRERYGVDAEGRKQGGYERFHADGDPAVRASYVDDRLDGDYEELDPGGVRRVFAHYRRGELHGTLQRFAADGVRELFETWRDGQLDGRRETFWPNGERRELTNWRAGARDGRFEEVSEDGATTRSGAYADGALHGSLKIVQGRRTLSKQVWDHGELARLDDLAPFPERKEALRERLSQVLAARSPEGPAGDLHWEQRCAALRRLQVYRALCGLPWADLSLEPDWNGLCDAAAQVCRANGGISHDPPKPPGMDDELYRRGRLGAGSSNLHQGQPSMAAAVDGFLDDSDPSNIARLGHRRWCLAPTLGRTAFGADGGYVAMWALDASGRAPRGVDAVAYPPAGWTPADLFGPGRAFSVALLRGSWPAIEELEVTVRALDEHWLAAAEALELEHLAIADAGFGTGPCLVFRPRGLRVADGAAYLVDVRERGARQPLRRYVVAFCAPLGGP
ncbi:MAG: hypothetical protein IPM29_30655 [Planctomycetes bacterium]|nr:hypothetical protein [Planctomycetota bacterium]